VTHVIGEFPGIEKPLGAEAQAAEQSEGRASRADPAAWLSTGST
jgi:hypothetical protein